MTGPAYTDIHQQLGGIGDCWLMATLADAAYRNPSLIRNMFTSYGNYNENGLTVQIYGVHFYNTRGQETTVLVDNQFPATASNCTAYAGVYGDVWVALAEKAYVIAATEGITVDNGGANSYTAINNNGYATNAMEAVTGRTASVTTTPAPGVLSSDGYLEVLATPQYQPSSTLIVPSHAYAVLSTTVSGALNDALFNPWNTVLMHPTHLTMSMGPYSTLAKHSSTPISSA